MDLPKTARCGVARVLEGTQLPFTAGGVELLEGLEGQDDLASNGGDLRHVGFLRGESSWNRRDVSQVARDVLSRVPVAPGQTLSQTAPLVDQLDGRSVELGLGHEFDVRHVSE